MTWLVISHDVIRYHVTSIKTTCYLHLDRVPVLERFIQYTGSVDHLPPQVLVVSVSHIQRLGGEGVRLHLHIGAGYVVYKRGLADVGEPDNRGI